MHNEKVSFQLFFLLLFDNMKFRSVNTDKDYNKKPLSLSDDKEFQKLFDGFYVPLCVFANKYVDDAELSADIVQDCFLKLWQIRNDFFYMHQVKSFLYTSVRNR